ncbi:MAG: hypothetical protein EKK41_24630 [Hyphomicrobiales bacterium]|nr:MAG: hypothetical protein EKK41_24630 [Hyphomicrobiales bacterium]
MLEKRLYRLLRRLLVATVAVMSLITASLAPSQAEVSEIRIAYQHSMAFLVVDVLLAKRMIEARAAAAGLDGVTVSAVRLPAARPPTKRC